MNKFFITDSSGAKSITATAFFWGFLILNFKLLFSGVEVMDFKLAEFSGADFAVAMGALGAIYVLRRKDNGKETTKD